MADNEKQPSVIHSWPSYSYSKLRKYKTVSYRQFLNTGYHTKLPVEYSLDIRGHPFCVLKITARISRAELCLLKLASFSLQETSDIAGMVSDMNPLITWRLVALYLPAFHSRLCLEHENYYIMCSHAPSKTKQTVDSK